jgi:hypothetical protein
MATWLIGSLLLRHPPCAGGKAESCSPEPSGDASPYGDGWPWLGDLSTTQDLAESRKLRSALNAIAQATGERRFCLTFRHPP